MSGGPLSRSSLFFGLPSGRQSQQPALQVPRRGYHIDLGAREKALLEEDSALKRFKSYKNTVKRVSKVGDALTILVIAAECGRPCRHKDSFPKRPFEYLRLTSLGVIGALVKRIASGVAGLYLSSLDLAELHFPNLGIASVLQLESTVTAATVWVAVTPLIMKLVDKRPLNLLRDATRLPLVPRLKVVMIKWRKTGAMTGYCTFLEANLISWSAKNQPTIIRSNTEVECRTITSTIMELILLFFLLKGLQEFQHPHTRRP